MRKTICFCLGILMMFSVIGCGNKTKSENRVTVRFVTYEYLPSQVKVQNNIIDAFNKSQNHTKVVMDIAEKPEKILTQLAGGKSSAPDVFLCFNGNISDLAGKGVLLQLDSLVNTWGQKKDYFPELFQTLTADTKGKLFAFPTSWGADALAYNKDLFDKAGLQYPNESWTWDDFLKAAQKLTIQQNGRTIQFGAASMSDGTVLNSYGVKFFSEDMKKCTINDPDIKNGLQFLVDLGSKYKVVPNVASMTRSEQFQNAMDMFISGRAAMYILSSFQFEALSKAKNLHWDMAPIPRHNNVKRKMAPGINTLVIYKDTDHPKEAWEFIKFFCGPEGQRLLGKNCIPAHKEVAYKYFLVPPPEHVKVLIDQYEGVTFNPWSYTAWGNEYLQKVYLPELDKILLGLTTVDKAVEVMQKEGEKYLKKARK